MHEILSVLLKYNEIVLIGAAVFTFFVTQLLKLPIKKWTSAIKDENTRKAVNAVILLLPFIFGCLYEFLYARCYLHETFNLVRGLQFGMSGISTYAIVERFLKKKTNIDSVNVYTETEDGKAVADLVKEVTADGKIDKDDISAVEKFLGRFNK